jgi:hypothetical protein
VISIEGAPAPDGGSAELWTLDQSGAIGMTASVKFA